MKGFTLIETVIYVSIVTIVSSILLLTVLNNLSAYNKSESQQNVFQNANDALAAIMSEIKYAKSVYTPTSVFNTNAGQLSLETTIDLPADETSTFVDFYLDNGVIYEKKEGQAAFALTTDRVVITKLRFTDVATGTKHSVTAQISGHINTSAGSGTGAAATINVTSSASLRGAY